MLPGMLLRDRLAHSRELFSLSPAIHRLAVRCSLLFAGEIGEDFESPLLCRLHLLQPAPLRGVESAA